MDKAKQRASGKSVHVEWSFVRGIESRLSVRGNQTEDEVLNDTMPVPPLYEGGQECCCVIRMRSLEP